MPILHAIVLGITQGLSEFLPISSSGHLQLVPWLLGWDDFAGHPHLEQTFDVALHLGTLIGAVAYFRRDLARYAIAAFREPRGTDGRIAWLLLASAVPGGIAGAALEDTFAKLGDTEWTIGLFLIVFGLVLLWADRLAGLRVRDDFQAPDAGFAGIAQALALAPGVSRSGVTITALRWRGFDRDASARLSFLMSLPIIAGACAFKALDLRDGFPAGFGPAFGWGIVASGITGFLAVWLVLTVVRRRSFTPFVVYRVLAGAAVIVVAATGLR